MAPAMKVIRLHVRVEAIEVEGLGWVQVSDIGGVSPLATKHPPAAHDYGPHADVVVTQDDYGEVWRPEHPAAIPEPSEAPEEGVGQ